MNKLIIIGNLTRDPETRQLASGSTVCSFTVAVNCRKKADGQPDADFFRVRAWGKTGEACQRYLLKGRKVSVVGPVSVSTYETKDGDPRFSLDVYAEDVEFLSAQRPAGSDDGYSPARSGPYDNMPEVDDDDLPF